MLTQATTRPTGADPAAEYLGIRAQTEAFADRLSPEDQTVQSMPDVSPTKWHRGHTSWFFESFVLAPHLPGYKLVEPSYGYLFNSYYESVGDRLPRQQRGTVSRPGASEVGRYRRLVDEAMCKLLGAPIEDDVAGLVELGLHHEQQHQELMAMDIKHVLWSNPSFPAYREERPGPRPRDPQLRRSSSPEVRFEELPGGVVSIGHGDAGFAFDNERPRHDTLVQPFALASRPATCGDWLEFIADGGYRRPELWLSDGWAKVCGEGWESPLYWLDRTGERDFAIFTLHGLRDLDAAEPACHVSFYEADAFARWQGGRLPTEAEWESVASHQVPTGRPVLHPRPIGDSAPMFGDVWQWTLNSYGPYPGFRPAAGAVGEYNGKFMVGQYVLRGGSCVTPLGHVRPTYRNFFPPAARWPFTGVRVARDL